MKTSAPTLTAATAPRLRAIVEELRVSLGLKKLDDFADLLGGARNKVSNWINGSHPPTIHDMIKLCDTYGFTLDWIYRGRVEGLAYDKHARLTARMNGLTPPEVPKSGVGAKPAATIAFTDSRTPGLVGIFEGLEDDFKLRLMQVAEGLAVASRAPDHLDNPSDSSRVAPVGANEEPSKPKSKSIKPRRGTV